MQQSIAIKQPNADRRTGVGKTTIAEGLAHRIVQGDCPDSLKKKELTSLDMGSLITGTKYHGEFEEKLKALLLNIEKSEGYDPAFGARPLKRLIQQEVDNLFATAILENKIPSHSELFLTGSMAGDKFQISYEIVKE